MKKQLVLNCLFVFFILTSGKAQTIITSSTVDLYTRAFVTGGTNDLVNPAPAPASGTQNWSGNASSAGTGSALASGSYTSQISAGSFSLSGTASASRTNATAGGVASANSLMTVIFSVPTASEGTIALTGSISSMLPEAYGRVAFYLYDDGIEIWSQELFSTGSGSDIVSLTPGNNYTLQASISATVDPGGAATRSTSASSSGLTMTVAAVPEPSTLLLLGLGTLGVCLMKRRRRPIVRGVVAIALLASRMDQLHAGSATWKTNPPTSEWSTPSNWSVGGPPNTLSQTATFGTTTQVNITSVLDINVGSVLFDPGASSYSITAALNRGINIGGAGITNNSANFQGFNTLASAGDYSSISFTNSASIGSNVVLSNSGSSGLSQSGGLIVFNNTSSAGFGYITTYGGTVSGASHSNVQFLNDSGAGNATVTARGGNAAGALGGRIQFLDNSRTENSTLRADAGVTGSSGGLIQILGDSTGGVSRVQVFGNGRLEIGGTTAPVVAVGSLEGDGIIDLGDNRLRIANGSLDTTFSGVIQGGVGGGLEMLSPYTLTLSGDSTYTNSTQLGAGRLIVDGSLQSSVVNILNGGNLGGTGSVQGIRVLNGGVLAPGNSPGTLTATTLDWDAGGILEFELGPTSDLLTLSGALTNNVAGVHAFRFMDAGLVNGQTYDLIRFASSNFLASEFSTTGINQPGGSFSISGNTVQFTVAPEPTTGAMAMLGGLALCLYFSRTNRTVRS